MKKLKTTVKKSEQLQGPVKTKKITVTDFKNENKFKKSVKELNETLAKKADKLKNLVSYKGFLNDKLLLDMASVVILSPGSPL